MTICTSNNAVDIYINFFKSNKIILHFKFDVLIFILQIMKLNLNEQYYVYLEIKHTLLCGVASHY